ncbi:hypothetical protein BCV71DRAFT_237974 [Rhizopus microsporus]|uniref:Uncharacterized protein n=1 Tax=Rhizopus microsporus TaxID=58291 RepID=A0A1X0RSC9_RHIZD|nr:hypothetical protein BCV71DRAFT_237974 [Rhizopus microsporus]
MVKLLNKVLVMQTCTRCKRGDAADSNLKDRVKMIGHWYIHGILVTFTFWIFHMPNTQEGNAPLELCKKKENKIIHLRKRVLPRKLWPKRPVETKYTHSKENNKYPEWHSLSYTNFIVCGGLPFNAFADIH